MKIWLWYLAVLKEWDKRIEERVKNLDDKYCGWVHRLSIDINWIDYDDKLIIKKDRKCVYL